MQSLLKKLMQSVLILLTITAFPVTSLAAEGYGSANLSARKYNNQIEVTYSDREAAGEISYTIIGLDITYYNDDGKEVGTARLAFDETQTELSYDSDHTHKIYTKYVSSSRIRSALKSISNKAYSEFEDSTGAYTIDAVMAVSVDYGETYSGYITYDEEAGKAVTNPNLLFQEIDKLSTWDKDGDLVFGHGEGYNLTRVYNWGNNGSSVLSNTDISLNLKHTREDEFSEDTNRLFNTVNTWSETTDSEGADQRSETSPYFATYNDSRAYTDTDGSHAAFTDEKTGLIIPSGEQLINGITVDSLFGSVDVGLKRAVHTWNFTFDYIYHVITYNVDGSVIVSEHPGSVDVDIERPAYYYYISDADLYSFKSAKVSNDAFEDKEVSYDASEYHLVNESVFPEIAYDDAEFGAEGPVSSLTLRNGSLVTAHPRVEGRIMTDGETHYFRTDDANADGYGRISTFAPDDDAHVKWAEIDETRDLGFVGRVRATSSDATRDTVEDRAYEKAWYLANEAVGDGDSIEPDTDDNFESYAYVTNDLLVLGYGSTVVLDGEEYPVSFKDSKDNYRDVYTVSIPPYLEGSLTTDIEISTETYETSPAFGKAQIKIPEERANGEYFTDITALYERTFFHTGATKNEKSFKHEKASVKDTSEDPSYPAIKSVEAPGTESDMIFYAANEPINILTPVISPVTLHTLDDSDHPTNVALNDANARNNTQLSPTKKEEARSLGLTMLKLDEKYCFSFDAAMHLEKQGYMDSSDLSNAWDETENKYDKYTKAKYVHFPFDVILYHGDNPVYYRHSEKEPSLGEAEEDDDGTQLTVKDAEGGQYWIMLDSDQWESATFYIPSWAHEDIYNKAASGKKIRYRVDSQNVVSDDEDEEDSDHRGDHTPVTSGGTEHSANTDESSYIAVYEIDVEVSGWLYDFEITGTSAASAFSRTQKDGWISFVAGSEEKKSGNRTRTGSNHIRYTLDGTVTNSWKNSNTLILANGKSNAYTGLGTLPMGSAFTYTFKTISNLWNSDDYVIITPSYRYVDKDGNIYSQSDFNLYYEDLTEYGPTLKKFGSDAEQEDMETVSLSDPGFYGTYNDAELRFTARNPHVVQSVGGTQETKFDISYSDTDALDQAAKDLKAKRSGQFTMSQIVIPASLRLFNGHTSLLEEGMPYIRNNAPDLYSFLSLPTEDADPATMDTIDREQELVENLFTASMQQWFGVYHIPDRLYVTRLTEDELRNRMDMEGGIDSRSNVFERGGYLILGFDIATYRGGSKDLVYGNTLNMWDIQGQDTMAKAGVKNANEKTINVQYGEIALIDLSDSLSGEKSAKLILLD